MVDLITVIAAAGGGGATWATRSTVAWFKARAERAKHAGDIEVTREQHQDNFLIEIIGAARTELAAARVDADEMRSLQLRLLHFEEALDHIQALIDATDAVERLAAEKRGRQFLTRMQRFSEARGTLANEAQVQTSKDSLGV